MGGTFHAIGNRLPSTRHLNLDPAFTVLDRGDAADLLDSIREELGFATRDKRFPRKDVCLMIYSHRVNTQNPLKETLESQYPWCLQWQEELTQLYRTYVERKQQLSLLGLQEELRDGAMMQEPRFAKAVGERFDHVLVDEYQDTNALQAASCSP
ncbi:MAG: UvrD-helicase domain-containing protein [Steroidobacteraceae bacterium]